MGKNRPDEISPGLEISDEDIFDAMKETEGYIDITPGDFKEVYRLAHRHAVERIRSSIRARDIMTTDVLSVSRQSPLGDVAEEMARRAVAGVPVVEADGTVAGVISEKDFLARMAGEEARSFMSVIARCLRDKGCLALPMRARKAEDIMSSPAVTVGEEATLAEVAEVFTAKNINRVPVVDGEGRMTGIVSRADVVRASGTGRR
jgi:CBS domain-containing membrane protein